MSRNYSLYDERWNLSLDMKVHGPASRWLRYLIRGCLLLIKDKPLTSILDVGCGEGTNTMLLAKQFPNVQVIGTDISVEGISAAKTRYFSTNLSYHHDPDSAFLNVHYDLITCFEVLEHVEEWQDLLQKMVHSSENYLLLSFPTGRMRPFEKNVGHLRNFKKGEVEAFLSEAGFRPYKISYAGFPFYSPCYRELCNLTNAADNSFTRGAYGFRQKFVSLIFYFCFTYLSTKERYGDQFIGLFERIK